MKINGKKLRAAREAENKTQAEVAAEAGCTPQNIQYIESRDRANINIHVLKPIAKLLKVHYKELADC